MISNIRRYISNSFIHFKCHVFSNNEHRFSVCNGRCEELSNWNKGKPFLFYSHLFIIFNSSTAPFLHCAKFLT